MSSLMDIVPQKAVLAENEHEVDADEVKVGTRIAVKAGEIIPIDGIVVEGRCEVDEKTLTGESFPVSKQVDSTVLAGTINMNGYISVQTTALAEDCVRRSSEKQTQSSEVHKHMCQGVHTRCLRVFCTELLVARCGRWNGLLRTKVVKSKKKDPDGVVQKTIADMRFCKSAWKNTRRSSANV